MPVFTKESHNHFDVDHFEVDNSFGFRITVDGDYFAFAGMSLGDLVTINQHIAEAIRRGVEVRYEVSQEPKDVEPGDIAVMRLVTTKGAVKWTCGTVRCFTDDNEDPAIVLTTGKIPEYDGYELVCRIRPIPDVVQMTFNDDGEVIA